MPLLLFIASMLSLTAFADAPQLSCTNTDKGTQQQQLTITPNALGSYDVALHTPGRQPSRIWLALQLNCEVRNPQTWHCIAAQDSPHVHSTLHSKTIESGQGIEINITSPLLLAGKEHFRFAHKQCIAQAQALQANSGSPSCQAHFRGAHYDPDQGDCVEKARSGCRNPFPYQSRTECRAALKL